MSSITFGFEVVGDNRVESIFNNLAEIPDDFRSLFDQLAGAFYEHEQRVFDSEGPGWRPLSPKYAAWKERHYPGTRILERTGRLRASLTSDSGPDSIYEVYPNEMIIGTSVPYAIYHQTGSIKIPNHPPQRKEMTVPASLQVKWNRLMVAWLREEVDMRS